MLKTYDFHSLIQRPHFSQTAKNLFRASFLTPSDIAAYIMGKDVGKIDRLSINQGQYNV